ncbi:MAG: N-acetylmuramic acid 6-phosphate etherase, partial [Microbacterium sp.]
MTSQPHTAPTPSLSRTEQRHPDTGGLDSMSSLELVSLMNREDHRAIDAVDRILPQLAALVDEAVARMRRGGVVHYFGAGTSGRLAVLDAAELLPTFNLPEGMVNAHIAGGSRAIVHAVENSEDSRDQGREDAAQVGSDDIVLGLAASGATPYVHAALVASANAGAYTALITSNPDAPLAVLVDAVLVADTGPEVLTGSTRLKAGTALKVILNAFSTALMVQSGRVW